MDLIYCVEDDEGIRRFNNVAVKSAGFEAEGFESASDFEKLTWRAFAVNGAFGYNATG